jgi:hypothetical protein
VLIDGGRISFTGGVFRLVSNWNVLVPFGRGVLEVNPAAGVVRYRLDTRQLMTIASVFIALAITTCWIDTGTPVVLVMAPLLWLLVVGGILGIGLSRFSDFLRHSLDTAPRRARLWQRCAALFHMVLQHRAWHAEAGSAAALVSRGDGPCRPDIYSIKLNIWVRGSI